MNITFVAFQGKGVLYSSLYRAVLALHTCGLGIRCTGKAGGKVSCMVPGVAGELALKMTGCAPGPWGQHCGVARVQGPASNGADKLAICCCMTFRNNIFKKKIIFKEAPNTAVLLRHRWSHLFITMLRFINLTGQKVLV